MYVIAIKDRDYIKKVASSVSVPPFVPKAGVKIAVTDAEAQSQTDDEDGDNGLEFLKTIPSPIEMTPLEFEKVC